MTKLPTPKGARKPAHPCKHPFCSNKVKGSPYCPKHELERKLEPKQNNWHTKKGPTDPFYYSKAWRRTTKAYRRANPLCEKCDRKGKLIPATCTDHITPWKNGGSKFDWNNLQALCYSCHAKKTAKENAQVPPLNR